jgi:hypothetical protein
MASSAEVAGAGGGRRPKVVMGEPGVWQGQQAGRIRDARGRTVSQLDPVALWLLRRHDVVDADALRAVAHEHGVRITRGQRISLIIGVAGVVLVLGLLVQSLVAGDFGDAPLARSSSLLLFCCSAWVYWARSKRTRIGHIAAAMLRHLRCPHCGYNLRLLPPDSADGATVCPECGCAWKLDDRRQRAGDHPYPDRRSSTSQERRASRDGA